MGFINGLSHPLAEHNLCPVLNMGYGGRLTVFMKDIRGCFRESILLSITKVRYGI